MPEVTNDKACVVGIDPSIAGSGVTIIKADLTTSTMRFPSKNRGTNIRERIGRYNSVICRIVEYIGDLEPVVICIENYSFGSTGKKDPKTGEIKSFGRQNMLGEFGGILRADMCVYENAVIREPAISTVKKFATGNGKAKKEQVAAAVLERWDVGFSSDDEFDSFVLGIIASCIAGWHEAETGKQLECLKTITGMDYELSESALFVETQKPVTPEKPF